MTKMYPTLNLMKRGLSLALWSRKGYLKGLGKFSHRLTASLRPRKEATRVITMSELAKGFPKIAAALKENDIRSISFSLKHYDFFLPEQETNELIAQAIRAGIRNLATYKLPKKEQTCSFFSSAGYHAWMNAHLTVKAYDPHRPELSIEVYKNESDYQGLPR